MVASPPLVACAHGTRDPSGRAAIDALRTAVAAARPHLEVVEAYVDENVQRPALAEALSGRESAVVVPLLLSSGYHVHVDIPRALAHVRSDVTVARPLGPDRLLAAVVAARLEEAGAAAADAVVLAAAGSSDGRAAADVEEVAHALEPLVDRPVTPAYLSAATPRVAEAVAGLRGQGRRVAVAAYLLAPGHFSDRLGRVGAEVVTAPLLPDPRPVDLVLARYDEALVRAG